jgi:hypothetical protein
MTLRATRRRPSQAIFVVARSADRRRRDAERRFERSSARCRDRRVVAEPHESRRPLRLASPGTRHHMVAPAGIEPATRGLGNRCSIH